MAGAWYECSVLLGPLSPADLAGGFALESLWLCFVTSLVAALASMSRGVLGAVGWAIGALLVLTAAGGIVPVAAASWLPTRLAGSAAALTSPVPVAGLWHAVIVTAAAAVALMALAVRRTGRREV